jgi:hypothetical protein
MQLQPSLPLVHAAPGVRSAKEHSRLLGLEDPSNAIATAAYYKAEARGFTPDHELDDWLAAEAESDA